LDLNTLEYTTLPVANGKFLIPGENPGTQNEFATAMAKNHDGSQVYFLTPSSYLYHFDVDNETLKNLGSVNTPDEIKQNIKSGDAFSLVMSLDEKYLYSIPSSMSNGAIGLYRYNIAAGVWEKLMDLTDKFGYGYAAIVGGEIDADGFIYFARFNDDEEWVQLLRIDANYFQQ
jgi:hypothetical protein